MNQKQKKIVLALCGIAVLSLIAAGLYLACGRKSLQKNNPQTDKQVQAKQQENEPQATKNHMKVWLKVSLLVNILSRLWQRSSPYAIMINNIEYAFQNQKGHRKQILFMMHWQKVELPAEGGLGGCQQW